MSFDEALLKAKIFEDTMYLKVYKNETLFRIKRRDSERLYLSCRKDDSCKFSIRYGKSKAGFVKLLELKQLHSCSVQKFQKPVIRVRKFKILSLFIIDIYSCLIIIGKATTIYGRPRKCGERWLFSTSKHYFLQCNYINLQHSNF